MNSLSVCSICFILFQLTDGQSLIFKFENWKCETGTTCDFSCVTLNPFNSTIIAILKGVSEVAICDGVSYQCTIHNSPRYSFIANVTGVFGSIHNVTREDEDVWKCSYKSVDSGNYTDTSGDKIHVLHQITITLEIKVENNIPTIGSRLEFSCQLSAPFDEVYETFIYKGSERGSFARCSINSCNCRKNCSVVVNSTGVFGVLHYLSFEDEGTWFCGYSRGYIHSVHSNYIGLIVYILPAGLSITQNPDHNVELSESSVEMFCKTTKCAYRVPSIKWNFHDQTSSSDVYYSSGNTTEVDENCTLREKIYTSTLHLPLYTTFNDNSDKTGTFYCIIEYPNSSVNIISSMSHTLRFPVHVRNISIDPPGNTITLLDGTNTSLRCTAGPSRPAAVIGWWLDGTEVTNFSSTNTTVTGYLFSASSKLDIIVNKTLQDKIVYCDARVKGQDNAIDSVKQEITVLYAPDVLLNVSGSMLNGSTAVLKCTAHGKPPQYKFHSWIHRVGQTEIRRLNGLNTDSISILTLSSISIQDMGTYICNVDNSITGLDGQLIQSGESHVLVQGPPAVGVTATVFTGEIGKCASIQIPFYSYSSKASVKLSKRLDELEISNDTSNAYIYVTPSDIKLAFYKEKVTIPGYLAVLLLQNVTEKDFQKYTIQLSNVHGNVTVEFEFAESEYISTHSKDDNQLSGLGVGGVVGIAVGGVAYGCIVAITIFIIRSRVNGSNRTCFKGMKQGKPHEPAVKYVHDDDIKSTDGHELIINRQQEKTDILGQEGIAQNMDHGYLDVVSNVREDDGYLRPWTGIEDPAYNYII